MYHDSGFHKFENRLKDYSIFALSTLQKVAQSKVATSSTLLHFWGGGFFLQSRSKSKLISPRARTRQLFSSFRRVEWAPQLQSWPKRFILGCVRSHPGITQHKTNSFGTLYCCTVIKKCFLIGCESFTSLFAHRTSLGPNSYWQNIKSKTVINLWYNDFWYSVPM